MSAFIKKTKILYITYDGMMESIGSSQILPIIKKLSKNNHMHILSFEKKEDIKSKEYMSELKKLNKNNVIWIALRYWSYPKTIATMANIIKGAIICCYLIIIKKVRIIHIRSSMPGLLVAPFIRIFRLKILYDMRGFWADEKVDRYGWNNKGLYYKFFKKLEENLILKSERIICLTNHSIKILNKKFPQVNRNKFICIPTCSDESNFKLRKKYIQTRKKNIIFGYLGTVKLAYNFEKVIFLFSKLLNLDKNIKIRIFNKGSHNHIRRIMKKYKIPKNSFQIKFVERKRIHREISTIDLGIFYLNTNYSINASFPTKIAEFFLSGKPIICNPFNNDIINLFKKNQVGISYDFKETNYRNFLKKIRKMISNKKTILTCREIGEKKYSLSFAAKNYNLIYQGINLRNEN
mgnify:FL=1